MLAVDTGLVLDGYHARDEASTSPFRIREKFSIRGGKKKYDWASNNQSNGATLKEPPFRENIERELKLFVFPRFDDTYTNLCTNPVPASVTGYSDVGTVATSAAYDEDRRAISVDTAATADTGVKYEFTATAAAYSGGIWVLAPLNAPMEVLFNGETAVAFTGTGQPQFVKTENKTLTAATRSLQVIQTDATARTFYVWFTTIVLGAAFPTGADGRPATFHGACGDATWNGTANASTSTTITGQDLINHAIGRLAQVGDRAEALSHLGGIGITQRLRGSTEETYGKMLAGEVTEVQNDFAHAVHHIAEVDFNLVLDPICYAPERLAGSIYRRAGQSIASGTIGSIEGDLMAPCRIEFTPTGEEHQRYFAFGMQYRDYVSGTSLEIAAASMELSFNGLTYSGTLTAAANEVQTIDRTGTISSGTYTLTCDNQTTSAIAYDANAATIQAALEALANIGSGNVAVTGGPISTTDAVLTFQGDLAGCNVPALTISTSLGGGGTAVMVQTTAGHGGYVSAALYDSWTTICDTGNVSLVGPYRVTAVVYDAAATTDVGAAKLKLVHGVGDKASTSEAPLKPSPVAVSDFSIVDFGRVDIPQVPTGTQRWRGAIEGLTEGTLGASMRIVKIRFEPLECGDGVVKLVTPVESTLLLSDDFSGISGAMAGDNAVKGGAWASIGGVSDTTDFNKTSGADSVDRVAVNDTNTNIRYGRIILLGTQTFTDVTVGVTSRIDTNSWGSQRIGVVLRATDDSNFLAAVWYAGNAWLYKVLAGTVTSVTKILSPRDPNTATALDFTARSNGAWQFSRDGVVVNSGTDSDLASGTLASGKCGIVDWNPSSDSDARYFTNFHASALPTDDPAAAYSDQPLEIRDTGEAWRKDSAGAVYGYPQKQTIPNAPMLGPSGAEGLTNRVYADWSRYNPDLAAHVANDPGRLDVYYRPAYEVAAW